MLLTKPCQQHRPDLRETIARLEWSGNDLSKTAETLLTCGDVSGTNELITLAFSNQDMQDKFLSYSDEMANESIVRDEAK